MRLLANNRFCAFGKLFFIAGCFFQIAFVRPGYANFINGRFEASYIPDATTCSPIAGWVQTGYYFNGVGTSNPTSIDDIKLQSTGGKNIKFCGVTDIIIGTTETLDDYFLDGVVPAPTLLLPAAAESQSAMINLRSIDHPLTKVGSRNSVSGWTNIQSQASSLSQQMIVQDSDIDKKDGKVHIRFIAAPVLQNPDHSPEKQPFIAIQLNNITTGRTGSNPLFFQWSYGGQPSVAWQTLTEAGTNDGSASNYQYTNLRAFDIAPGKAFIHVGDVIELIAVASGCSRGGHDGHMYLDEVGTSLPSRLWISATGPISSAPGSNITYTYTYTNNSASIANNVKVIANMPQQGNPSSLPAQSTSFVSVSTPTVGTSPSCSGTNPVTCSIGTLQPGQSGTFQITVKIPSDWPLSTGPVNNGTYPISATGHSPLLNPLVQTNLIPASDLSNFIADASGLPGTATVDQSYYGTFSCSNVPTDIASNNVTNGSCDIANLPAGLSEVGCTISPSNTAWNEPATIPLGETVTCRVSGKPISAGNITALVTANADNNSSTTDNQVNAPIIVSNGSSVVIPATLNGSPILSPAVVCCGRPVLLGDLPVSGSGITTYQVTARTGNVSCLIGFSGTQAYLRMYGRHGSCTILGSKNGTSSVPLTIVTP